MWKTFSAIFWVILGVVIGFLVVPMTLFAFLDWDTTAADQTDHVVRNRAEYVDLLLTLASALFAAVNVAVTVGALVIGLVAFRTLQEIKKDAASEAAKQIKKTMDADLEPNVNIKVKEIVPDILSSMAEQGGLDKAILRVVERVMRGGPERNEEGTPSQPSD